MAVETVQIIGGGLAGTEAAWFLARHGMSVDLYEMRPVQGTPAHKTGDLAELVCSNSFRSQSPTKAVGILKEEMKDLGSLTLQVAQEAAVPAGDALAVNRHVFSTKITECITQHPNIQVHRTEITDLKPLLQKGPVVVATGPLTSPALSEALKPLVGQNHLYFYDAISPIVDGATLDRSKVFVASRYGKGDDYLNCPMDEEQYYNFVRHLRKAQKVLLKPFEKEIYFEGCLPIEVMAERGDLTLAFGPMKPVGLVDPKTQKQPFAVVQLRQEDRNGVAFNLVGFQTKLTYPEQKRVFQMIPGLEKTEFFRLGSIHRNTYINAPRLLNERLALKKEPRVHFAGQITGTEGYVESAALGIFAGHQLLFESQGRNLRPPPQTTALGALIQYLVSGPQQDFQPMNVNFGIFPALPPGKKRRSRERKEAHGLRAQREFQKWRQEFPVKGEIYRGQGLATSSAVMG